MANNDDESGDCQKWASITWMISGYLHEVGNLHVMRIKNQVVTWEFHDNTYPVGFEGAKELRASMFPIQIGTKEPLRASQPHDHDCHQLPGDSRKNALPPSLKS